MYTPNRLSVDATASAVFCVRPAPRRRSLLRGPHPAKKLIDSLVQFRRSSSSRNSEIDW